MRAGVPRHATIARSLAGDRPPRYGNGRVSWAKNAVRRSTGHSRGTGPRATVYAACAHPPVVQARQILPRSGSGEPELQRGPMPSGIRLRSKAGDIRPKRRYETPSTMVTKYLAHAGHLVVPSMPVLPPYHRNRKAHRASPHPSCPSHKNTVYPLSL